MPVVCTTNFSLQVTNNNDMDLPLFDMDINASMWKINIKVNKCTSYPPRNNGSEGSWTQSSRVMEVTLCLSGHIMPPDVPLV